MIAGGIVFEGSPVTGEYYAVDLKTGGNKHIGGAFGPSSPVIVGGTLYMSNIYGWVLAMPLSEFTAEATTGREESSIR